MLDRALAKTFANLSTLLLVALVIAGPIHLIHALVFKEAIAVAEIGPEIRAFPEGRQVRGVSRADLEGERTSLLVLLGIEGLLLPVVLRAARRVIQVDDEDGVPTVVDAWTHLGSVPRTQLVPGPVSVAVAVGLGAGGLVWMIGNLLADMSSADIAWVVTGGTRATSVALFTAITCGVAASLKQSRVRPAPTGEKLDLY